MVSGEYFRCSESLVCARVPRRCVRLWRAACMLRCSVASVWALRQHGALKNCHPQPGRRLRAPPNKPTAASGPGGRWGV